MPGSGSQIPCSSRNRKQTDKTIMRMQQESNMNKIMIIEDDPVTRDELTLLLENEDSR